MMDVSTSLTGREHGTVEGEELRAAPRFTLLIRAAKLVCAQGEFVCVIRDISETGVSVRLFHDLPSSPTMDLVMPAGGVYSVHRVWNRNQEAGFEFHHSVNVGQVINEAGEYPKRGLRLHLNFPITVEADMRSADAIVENISQQGARFECDTKFALDQSVQIRREPFPPIRAKIRWRREKQYGVVFDDTFTLGDFARFAAQMQAPALLKK